MSKNKISDDIGACNFILSMCLTSWLESSTFKKKDMEMRGIRILIKRVYYIVLKVITFKKKKKKVASLWVI